MGWIYYLRPIGQEVFFLSFLLSGVLGCSSDRKAIRLEEVDDRNTPVLVIRNEDRLNVNQLLASISYLQLKHNESEKVIASVDKITSMDRLILIMDKTFSKSVFVFDSTGVQLTIIDHFGTGPGEYSTLSDFDYDHDRNEVLILDDKRSEVLRYELLTGKYVGKYDDFGRFYIEEFVYFENQLLFHTGNSCDPNCNSLVIYDLESKGLSSSIPIPKYQEELKYGDLDLLTKTDQGVLVSQTFNNTTYLYKEGRIEPFLRYDAADKEIPDKDIFKGARRDLLVFQNKMNEFFQGPRRVLETPKAIYVESNLNYGKNWSFFSKGSKNTVSSNSISISDMKYIAFRPPKGVVFDQFVATLDADELKELKANLYQLATEEIDSSFLEILKSPKEFENPLLVLYQLNENE